MLELDFLSWLGLRMVILTDLNWKTQSSPLMSLLESQLMMGMEEVCSVVSMSSCRKSALSVNRLKVLYGE